MLLHDDYASAAMLLMLLMLTIFFRHAAFFRQALLFMPINAATPFSPLRHAMPRRFIFASVALC